MLVKQTARRQACGLHSKWKPLPAQVTGGCGFCSAVCSWVQIWDCRWRGKFGTWCCIESRECYENYILWSRMPVKLLSCALSSLSWNNSLIKLFCFPEKRRHLRGKTGSHLLAIWIAAGVRLLSDTGYHIMSLVAYVFWKRWFMFFQFWFLVYEIIFVKLSLVISDCVVSEVNDSRTFGPGTEMICFFPFCNWGNSIYPGLSSTVE